MEKGVIKVSDLELYKGIINANFLFVFVIYFSFFCVIINFIISLICDIKENNIQNSTNSKEKENNKDFNIVEFMGGIGIVLLFICLCSIITIISKYLFIIYIPFIILFFYMVYIHPMTTDKPSNLKLEYCEYGASVTFALLFFSKINYNYLFINIRSAALLQIICVFILLHEIYCCFYCLLLNVYFVIKNLKRINIYRFVIKYEKLKESIYSKVDFDKLFLQFNNTNSLFYNKHYSKIKISLLFFPFLISDIIINSSKFIFFIFISIILRPFFTIFSFIFSKIIQLSNTNENQINFGLTKIVGTFSIILVYIIMQINNIFETRIVDTYEFISSVIIIPIILESLISLKQKLT